MQSFAFDAIILHHDARTAYNLARVPLLVDLAEPSPCAENLGIADFDEVDLVLRTQRLDELDIFGFGTGLNEHAKMRLAFIERFGSFAKAAREAIVNECVLQNLLHEYGQSG